LSWLQESEREAEARRRKKGVRDANRGRRKKESWRRRDVRWVMADVRGVHELESSRRKVGVVIIAVTSICLIAGCALKIEPWSDL